MAAPCIKKAISAIEQVIDMSSVDREFLELLLYDRFAKDTAPCELKPY